MFCAKFAGFSFNENESIAFRILSFITATDFTLSLVPALAFDIINLPDLNIVSIAMITHFQMLITCIKVWCLLLNRLKLYKIAKELKELNNKGTHLSDYCIEEMHNNNIINLI